MRSVIIVFLLVSGIVEAHDNEEMENMKDEMENMKDMFGMKTMAGKRIGDMKGMLDLEQMSEKAYRPIAGLTGMLEMKVLIKLSRQLYGDLVKNMEKQKKGDMDKNEDMMEKNKGENSKGKMTLEDLWMYAEKFGLQHMLGLEAFYRGIAEVPEKEKSMVKESEDEKETEDDFKMKWDDFKEDLVKSSGFKIEKFKELVNELLWQMIGELKEMSKSGMNNMMGDGTSDKDKIEEYLKMMGGDMKNKTMVDMVKKMMKEKGLLEALGVVYMVNVIEQVKQYTWCMPKVREDPVKLKICIMIMDEGKQISTFSNQNFE